MRLQGYKHFGGHNPETAALMNVLAYSGIVAPHTGQPFTEQMLLGIGGGVGAGYFVMRFGGTPGMAIGTRHLWCDSIKFVTGLCERLGVKATVEETTGSGAALKNLKEALDSGSPAITYLDLASLPYSALPPEYIKGTYHVAVVYGHDDDSGEACIADRSKKSLTVSTTELADARKAITSFKNRIVAVQPPKKLKDLKETIRDGIRACCDGLLNARIQNFSIEALKKWGNLVGDATAKDGWTKVFTPGVNLYNGLMWTFRCIELWGTGGKGMRGMYADFLDEASGVVKKADLKEVATQYRECGKLWSKIGNTVLPDSVALLKETRELMVKKERLFIEKGGAGLPEMLKIRERLAAIEAAMKESFPLTPGEVQDLFSDLSGQILNLYEHEVATLKALKVAVR